MKKLLWGYVLVGEVTTNSLQVIAGAFKEKSGMVKGMEICWRKELLLQRLLREGLLRVVFKHRLEWNE